MRRTGCGYGLVAVVLLWTGCAPITEERTHELLNDGMLLYERNDGAARESFLTALDLQPRKAALLYNIGQCSERMNNLEEAEQAYQECLNRQPTHVPSRHAHRLDGATRANDRSQAGGERLVGGGAELRGPTRGGRLVGASERRRVAGARLLPVRVTTGPARLSLRSRNWASSTRRWAARTVRWPFTNGP